MGGEINAWTFTHGGYPKALQQSTLPADTQPLKPSEIRVKTYAASINPVDVQLMGFPLWPYLPGFVLPPHKGVAEDFSGVVQEAGPGSGFKPGDGVLGIGPFLPGGTLQETIRLDTKNGSVVVPKPADWSWEQAAALPLVWLTARTLIAEVESHVKNGRVAVLGGSSATGMYAVHLAARRGWAVAASCSGRNADLVRGMGAGEIVDYTTESVPGRLREFAPDVIIDCVGGTECLGIARRYATIVGDKTNRFTMGGANTYLWNPQMVLRALLGRFGLGPSYTCVNLEFKYPYLEEILSLPKDKIIIDNTFDFNQVREAFDRLNTGRARGKVIVRVTT
ncbi:putative reticulon-4-interacting protein mitochondrial precursor [Diaporthe ampelina]|uniref:Putative reticulon-4-interacting protein mitochondrial n=1 Tax=Diaporthe ampelina TaxID=1214573 RepID=A0A0G2FIU8_9PEZI|nr:putative reticulon-4-interacting protein mitochondrial precursor [Diaporthe ampelina]